MGVGHVVLIAAVTFFALGALRRVFWFARWRRYGRRGHGYGYRGRRDFGVPWLARAIDATPEQQTKLAELADRVRADFGVLREARAGVIDSLVEFLPGEALDESALNQIATTANTAYEKVRSDLVQSLAELHRTLTPAQRKQMTTWLQRRRGHAWA